MRASTIWPRPILYGAYHPMSIAAASGETDRPLQDVIVGGPLCESGDIFNATGRRLRLYPIPAGRLRGRFPRYRMRRRVLFGDGVQL